MKQTKKEILKTIKDIIEAYPNQTVALHLGTAFSDYPNIEDVTDSELLFALKKYSAEQELNNTIPHEEDIRNIIEEGQHLDINDIYEDEDLIY